MSQLFISRMPKMCAIPRLVSAPLHVKQPDIETIHKDHNSQSNNTYRL